MTDEFDLFDLRQRFDISIFPGHHRIVIATLLEELELLKRRVEALEIRAQAHHVELTDDLTTQP